MLGMLETHGQRFTGTLRESILEVGTFNIKHNFLFFFGMNEKYLHSCLDHDDINDANGTSYQRKKSMKS